jgi:hypothetical protein
MEAKIAFLTTVCLFIGIHLLTAIFRAYLALVRKQSTKGSLNIVYVLIGIAFAVIF